MAEGNFPGGIRGGGGGARGVKAAVISTTVRSVLWRFLEVSENVIKFISDFGNLLFQYKCVFRGETITWNGCGGGDGFAVVLMLGHVYQGYYKGSGVDLPIFDGQLSGLITRKGRCSFRLNIKWRFIGVLKENKMG